MADALYSVCTGSRASGTHTSFRTRRRPAPPGPARQAALVPPGALSRPLGGAVQTCLPSSGAGASPLGSAARWRLPKLPAAPGHGWRGEQERGTRRRHQTLTVLPGGDRTTPGFARHVTAIARECGARGVDIGSHPQPHQEIVGNGGAAAGLLFDPIPIRVSPMTTEGIRDEGLPRNHVDPIAHQHISFHLIPAAIQPNPYFLPLRRVIHRLFLMTPLLPYHWMPWPSLSCTVQPSMRFPLPLP